MEVILLQNTVFKSVRHCAGERVVVSEELGKKLIDAQLAVALPQLDEQAVVVDTDVKKPARRTAKKEATS